MRSISTSNLFIYLLKNRLCYDVIKGSDSLLTGLQEINNLLRGFIYGTNQRDQDKTGVNLHFNQFKLLLTEKKKCYLPFLL